VIKPNYRLASCNFFLTAVKPVHDHDEPGFAARRVRKNDSLAIGRTKS